MLRLLSMKETQNNADRHDNNYHDDIFSGVTKLLLNWCYFIKMVSPLTVTPMI